MDEQELNKKLALWAGFKLQAVWSFYVDLEKALKWTYPDKSFHKEAPSFTQSLDACFKWLVPELTFWEIISYNGLYMRVYVWAGEDSREFGKYEDTTCETPALALCLAIEKLIDGKENKDNGNPDAPVG